MAMRLRSRQVIWKTGGEAVGDQEGGGADARHVAVAAGAVGDVDGIDQAAELPGAIQQGLRVG